MPWSAAELRDSTGPPGFDVWRGFTLRSAALMGSGALVADARLPAKARVVKMNFVYMTIRFRLVTVYNVREMIIDD